MPSEFSLILMKTVSWHAQLLSHVWLFCDPIDCSPPGSSVFGILQARILGCHFLLQRSFLTQEWNLWLLHSRWILHCWVTSKSQCLGKTLCNVFFALHKTLCRSKSLPISQKRKLRPREVRVSGRHSSGMGPELWGLWSEDSLQCLSVVWEGPTG